MQYAWCEVPRPLFSTSFVLRMMSIRGLQNATVHLQINRSQYSPPLNGGRPTNVVSRITRKFRDACLNYFPLQHCTFPSNEGRLYGHICRILNKAGDVVRDKEHLNRKVKTSKLALWRAKQLPFYPLTRRV